MTFTWNPPDKPGRDRPPIRSVPLRVPFPQFQKGRTSTGHRWYAATAEDRVLAHAALIIPGGVCWDGDRTGLTRTMVQTMVEETVHRSRDRLAADIERLAAQISWRVTEDAVLIHLTSARATWTEAFPLFLEVLLEPGFSRRTVRREADRMIQQVLAERAEPEHLLRVHFTRLIFGTHPYHGVEPDLELLRRITRPNLLRHYLDVFPARGTSWVFAGGVPLDETLARLEREVPPVDETRTAETGDPDFPEQSRGLWVHRPESVQTLYALGIPGWAPDEERLAVDRVANAVLGGGAASRLFLRLREEKGYTYGAYSRLRELRRGGFWIVSAQVRREVFREAWKETVGILRDLVETGPGEGELEAARRFLGGGFLQHHQTLVQQVERIADCLTWGLPVDYWSTYGERLAAVAREDVRETYSRWMHRPWLAVVVGEPDGFSVPEVPPEMREPRPGLRMEWSRVEPDA